MTRSDMTISRFPAAFAIIVGAILLSQMSSAQTLSPSSVAGVAADGTNGAKLEHFDPNLVDKSLDPCNDFYKYSCNKWLTAHPIPADQVFWGTGSDLQLWNENLLRETLEAARKRYRSRRPEVCATGT
jgi:putative endopeptidase